MRQQQIKSRATVQFFAWCAAVCASFSVHAEIIQRIDVTGEGRVEKETVKNYLPSIVGQDVTPADVSTYVKRLHATGLFAEVNIDVTNGVMVVNVQENPLVNQVAFEGNNKIVSQRLEEIVNLAPRAIYTPAKVQRDVQDLLTAYRARGRFLTEVRPQVIKRDQNRVDVVYVITEGEKTQIKDIRFVGNERFDDGDLKSVVATKESAFWRFLSTADSYDPNRLEVDKELLRRHYIQHGYADFQVSSAVAELSPDKSKFFITYTLNEGPVYDFGVAGVNVSEQAEGVDAAELDTLIPLEAGDLYNAQRVENVVDVMIDHLGAKGFAFLDVRPEFNKNEAERKIDVTFNIQPGPRVYVNRINVEGNTRTRDHVLRREINLVEGDAFSSTKLSRSRDKLNFLGYFENVDIVPSETEDPDRVDLNVQVSEQSTGEFNVGAGFSSFEGIIATADIRERNLLGKGQDLNVRFSLSGINQNFNIGFTEPYFLGRKLAAGFDLFNEETDFQDESSFDLSNSGGNLRFTLPLGEFTSSSLRFGYRETEISDVGSGASSLVAREEGTRDSIFLANTLAFDNRDSFITPTRGKRLALTNEYSGFGSDIDFVRSQLNGSWHKEVQDGFVLSVGARAGAIFDLGQDLPIFDHFNAGGASLRGFEVSGIGPRDRVTDDSLGGQFLLGHNVELTFPIPSLKDLGVNGAIFTDGGIVTEFEGATNDVIDSQTYRVTAGAGLHWKSPVGPLRLEFGFPIVKAEEDKTQVFSFSIGTRF